MTPSFEAALPGGQAGIPRKSSVSFVFLLTSSAVAWRAVGRDAGVGQASHLNPLSLSRQMMAKQTTTNPGEPRIIATLQTAAHQQQFKKKTSTFHKFQAGPGEGSILIRVELDPTGYVLFHTLFLKCISNKLMLDKKKTEKN